MWVSKRGVRCARARAWGGGSTHRKTFFCFQLNINVRELVLRRDKRQDAGEGCEGRQRVEAIRCHVDHFELRALANLVRECLQAVGLGLESPEPQASQRAQERRVSHGGSAGAKMMVR